MENSQAFPKPNALVIVTKYPSMQEEKNITNQLCFGDHTFYYISSNEHHPLSLINNLSL
jgi:hypothetical protein